MRSYQFDAFGLEHLKAVDAADPTPGAGQVVLDVKAMSLNFRDLLVVKGLYNPKQKLPAVPLSDGAGVVSAVGEGVQDVSVGDRVTSHFISAWIDGPYRGEYGPTTLGTPGPGLAAQRVALPAHAVLPMPAGYDFAQAATLPIAALTAWSALVTEGNIKAGQTVLTLGTGGVSIFTLQLAKAMGAKVAITSSSDEKLERVRDMGADHTINYLTTPDWAAAVVKATGGTGADLTVESGGAGTLEQSMRATRAGGIIAFFGALTGLSAKVNLAPLLMRRLRLAGIYVDSRASFAKLNRFIEQHAIEPIIDRRFAFDELPQAFKHMEAGAHLGKIVIEL